MVAEGNIVSAHGRFPSFGQPANWIAADIIRNKDRVLFEH
jgi:hypothetical protein